MEHVVSYQNTFRHIATDLCFFFFFFLSQALTIIRQKKWAQK